MKSYVYKIVNKINNKIYIGKANNVEIRWAKHLYIAATDQTNPAFTYFHAALKKNGEINFNFEIIEELESEELAFEKEIYWINFYNSNNREIGYNLTAGGVGPSGRIQSQEEKLNKSIILKKYYTNHPHAALGRKLTDEHKKKISEGNLGKIMSDEAKNKISISNSGKNNGMFGKIPSLEDRELRSKKVREGKSKKNNSNKPFTLETINKLKIAARDKKSKFISDEQKDLIIEQYKTGQFLKRDLCDKFKLEAQTINYILRYWEQVKNNKIRRLEQEKQIISFYLLGKYTKKEISKIINVPFNRVKSVLKIYNNLNSY